MNNKMKTPKVITPLVGKFYDQAGPNQLVKEDDYFWYFSNGMRWSKDIPFTLSEFVSTEEPEKEIVYNDRAIHIASFLGVNAVKMQIEVLKNDCKRYAEMHLNAIKNSRGGKESTIRQSYASNLAASTGTELLMHEQALEILLAS